MWTQIVALRAGMPISQLWWYCMRWIQTVWMLLLVLTLLNPVRRQRMAPLEQRTVPAKVCKRCGLTKSASEFYRNKLMSDGLYSHCKVSGLHTSGSRRRSGIQAK